MWIRIVIVLIAIIITFTSVSKNKSDWNATIGITHKPPVKNNLDGIIQSNRAFLNEKFKGHYIDRVLSDGDIVRWNPETFPLNVYIENNPNLPDYYYKEVKHAFEHWQEVSDNFITFSFVNQIDSADIKCSFPADFNADKSPQGMVIGTSSFSYKDNMLSDSKIKFLIYNRQNKFWSANDIYSTALHEIGHSLGIKGHSINREDIMYPSTSYSTEISSNDINTLKLIYSIVPDVSNKEFPQEVKDKFLTANDVLGKGNIRFKIELESTKDDIRHTGRMTLHKSLKLANLYYKTAQYNQARNILEPMLETYPNEPRVYKTLAKVYKEQKDFEAFEKLYTRAKNIFPDNSPVRRY